MKLGPFHFWSGPFFVVLHHWSIAAWPLIQTPGGALKGLRFLAKMKLPSCQGGHGIKFGSEIENGAALACSPANFEGPYMGMEDLSNSPVQVRRL